MKRHSIFRLAAPVCVLLFGFTLSASADSLEKDREAIKSMAGSFRVNFRFEETKVVAPDYQLKDDTYEADAIEIVKVVEDTPKRIALQHLLVVSGKNDTPHVIKHWAQIWTYEDPAILDYCGEDNLHDWNKMRTTVAKRLGTWSQLVTQVDDTPRYESYGKWVHSEEGSVWKSQLTRRPLPRREYTKRDDYDYILATNEHHVNEDGWSHVQTNQKVVDRKGSKKHVLCHESGLNTYKRTETEFTAVANKWWEQRGAVWDDVRNFWNSEGEKPGKRFGYHEMIDGVSLKKQLRGLITEKSTQARVALSAYVDAD